MSELIIKRSTLTGLGDIIREKTGNTDILSVDDMKEALRNIGGGGAPNGTEWFVGTIASGSHYNCLTYGNGVWNSYKGSYNYYSFDGINWTKNDSAPRYIDKIAYSDGVWVGCSSTSTTTGFYYSYDGIEWTRSNIAQQKIKSLLPKRNGYWTCFNNKPATCWRSIDGVTWEAVTLPTDENLSSTSSILKYGDGKWIVGDGDERTYYVSTDALTWTAYNWPFEVSQYNKGCGQLEYFDGSWFVSSYANGYGLYSSSDAVNWTKTGFPDDAFPYSMNKGGGRLVCGTTSAGVYYSDDGNVWNKVSFDFSIQVPYVFYGNGIWIIFNDMNTENGVHLYYSSDCVNWKPCKTPVELGGSYGLPIVGENGILVFACNEGFFYSPVWEPST